MDPNNYNQTNLPTQNTKKKGNLQDFIRHHRILSIIIIVGGILLLSGAIILALVNNPPRRNPKDGQIENEKAPYITLEHTYLIEYPATYSEISDEILFYLQLILANSDEVTTAKNNENQERIASINEDVYNVSEYEGNEIYDMEIDISDERKYYLTLFLDLEYQNECAVAILKRADDSKTYLITFTRNKYEDDDTQTQFSDYITGKPLESLPTVADNWITNLELKDPEVIHASFNSIH